MYKVATPYKTCFAFSRFEAEEEAPPNQELARVGADASVAEEAEAA